MSESSLLQAAKQTRDMLITLVTLCEKLLEEDQYECCHCYGQEKDPCTLHGPIYNLVHGRKRKGMN